MLAQYSTVVCVNLLGPALIYWGASVDLLGLLTHSRRPVYQGEKRKKEKESRVEEWRGGLGVALRVTGSFVCRGLSIHTLLRFHSPLIEPDVRVSRIRLSDKDSCVRTRGPTRSAFQLLQPEGAAQVWLRVA